MQGRVYRQTIGEVFELTCTRAVWCGLICMPVGLAASLAHLPKNATPIVFVLSVLWAMGLATTLGALTGATAGLAAGLARRALKPPQRANAAAGIEAVIFTAVFFWLIVNEALCALTFEVFGWDTFLYLFYNPKAVIEASWEVAGNYMAGTLLVAAVFGLILFVTLRRYHLKDLNPAIKLKRRGLPTAVGVVIFLTVIGLGWQLFVRPGTALVTLAKALPALRAAGLPRTLLGDVLARNDFTPTWGPPLISEKEYAARMGKPDPALNVVLIFLESVPAKALGCYGRQRNVTPNIDALAAKSVLFEHCVAAASFSSYSLVSTVTSLYMLRDERNDHFRAVDFPFFSITRLMKLAGYEVALFSSGNEKFENIKVFYPPEDFDHYFSHDTSDIPKWDSMRMDDRHAVEAFDDWLNRRNDQRPFFCMFNLQSTHFNYEVPEPWNRYYLPVPPPYSSGNAIIYLPADLVPLMRNAYDNALHYLDHWVGRIRQLLDHKGILNNTLIVIVGDHGEGFMEHGLARHGVHVYEELVHVPLIFYAPQVLQPRRVEQTVSQLDLVPTIAAALGLKPHPSWQGQNILSNDYDGSGRPVFTVLQLTRWQEAAYLDGIKYIYDLSECNEWLFDLRRDPMERNDLTRSNPQLRKKMQDLLGRWHSRQLAYYNKKNRPLTHYIGTLPTMNTNR